MKSSATPRERDLDPPLRQQPDQAMQHQQLDVRELPRSSWYLKLAIAKRCRLNKSIRQRFAFALKTQQMACAMIKPAGSHSYLESAIARFQQAYYLKITSRSVVELEKKPAATQIQQRCKPTATQIQQRRKFRSDANSAATQIQQRRKLHLLHEKFRFLDAKQDS
ncbi:NB-ARC domain-containing disease resistance protein [Dorcoceras hygrometricum]|uniref:NB-ARC domain-containing disease resistance protein n=1 Tax=Dorcoceras hygrometricum TaxID=472368 RepID=A0A2Z7AI77_9LAMI|nr:NB-ARC domain-containing disease resistance protein [Dorcoceras hygrometricum]